jgi:hypothetical protein
MTRMSRWQFLAEPLEGRTSIGKVVWVYGVLGSLAYGALGLVFDAGDERAMHLYTIGGLALSVYVTVATYQCARNCKTAFGRRLVRVCAVLTLLLLPLATYLEWNGALDLTSLRGVE